MECCCSDYGIKIKLEMNVQKGNISCLLSQDITNCTKLPLYSIAVMYVII